MWSQTGNHPQEGLAKFGYRPDVKVEKIKNHAGTCCRTLAIKNFGGQIKAKSFTKILCMC
jgi:hypothetical protein